MYIHVFILHVCVTVMQFYSFKMIIDSVIIYCSSNWIGPSRHINFTLSLIQSGHVAQSATGSVA